MLSAWIVVSSKQLTKFPILFNRVTIHKTSNTTFRQIEN